MQQLSDFSKAKAGDKVESFCYGEGEIEEIKLENTCPIRVRFPNSGFQTYTLDGKINRTNVRSDLYYPGIPEFPVPERPKVKVKKTYWVNIYYFDSERMATSNLYKSKEDALGKASGMDCIGTYPLEIEVEE